MAQVDLTEQKKLFEEWLRDEAEGDLKNWTFDQWLWEDFIQCEQTGLWFNHATDFDDDLRRYEEVWVSRDAAQQYKDENYNEGRE